MRFEPCDAESLYDFVVQDPARHYFICHTLDAHKSFKGAWQLKVDAHTQIAVFLRHTGLLQVAMMPSFEWDKFENAFLSALEKINWQQAMVTDVVCQKIVKRFCDLEVNEGAKIMKCTPTQFRTNGEIKNPNQDMVIRSLKVTDLDEVVLLYQDVFTGFASKTYMAEKLDKNRGRAFGGFIHGKLVAVAQSDYESERDALIVGVATAKNLQRHGYGKRIFRHLCEQLVGEDKTLHLQYDSAIAGELYKNFGFTKTDQIYNIKRSEK